MQNQITELTIHEAAEMISRREITPLELTQAHLERIERLQPRLNCFITVTVEAALEQARQATEEIQRGNVRSRLHGIPLALKDLYECAGIRCTHGSTFYADYVPQQDSVVAAKLKSAGIVLLGKNNMHEIALGVTNVNPHYGPSRNPWDEQRMTGGSSGGSAAAVSAGMCMGSMGSDTGGSIRIPASLCGVVGLKPTFGRISLRGVIPLSWNMDHAGPLTRRVRDAAILLTALAGYDPDDPGSMNIAVDDYLARIEEGVQGWRVALASDDYFHKVDPQIQAAVQEAAAIFTRLGAHVESVGFPEAYEAAFANVGMVTTDAAAFHRERLETHPEGFGADILQRLEGGAARSSLEYALLRREQTRLRRKFERFFDNYDILLSPATPVVAPMIEGPDALEQARLLTRFTAPFNLTGLPAIVLPCGLTREGLPVGLQIVSRPWSEASLLRAAHAYEKTAGWRNLKPALD